MKIAYLILAYKDPKQLKRLTDRLSKTGDCYVHLDKKSDKRSFDNVLHGNHGVNVFSRYIVSWAGWSMVKAYFYLMHRAYESDNKYDRFVLLTGLDYPLMSDAEMLREFSEHLDTEYIMAYNIATSTVPTDKNKVLKKWYLDTPFRPKFLQRVYKSLMYRCLTKPFSGKQIKVRLGGNYVDPYFGQTLSAFTRAAVKVLIETYDNDKQFNKRMKHVHAPDEIYWHTIIFNSNFRKNTIQNGEEHEITEHFGWAPLHYHTYTVFTSVYQKEHFDELINSGYMFCRKVETGISDALLDKIDEYREK